jgi:integrase
MASITKLPSGKYYCQVRLRGKMPLYKSFASRTEAAQWAEDREAAIKQAPNYELPIINLTNETLKDIGLRYCVTILRGKSSQYETDMRIKRMAKHFPQPFSDINKWHVNNYRIERLKTVSPTTCRDELLILSRLFKWVKREYLIDLENPCDGIAFPKALKPRDKVVTPEEIKLLISIMTPIMKLVIELAYETAMRRAELLKLTPLCIHLDDRLLEVVDGKTGSRLVPLASHAACAEAYRRLGDREKELKYLGKGLRKSYSTFPDTVATTYYHLQRSAGKKFETVSTESIRRFVADTCQ